MTVLSSSVSGLTATGATPTRERVRRHMNERLYSLNESRHLIEPTPQELTEDLNVAISVQVKSYFVGFTAVATRTPRSATGSSACSTRSSANSISALSRSTWPTITNSP
jgi:hypothetical protein